MRFEVEFTGIAAGGAGVGRLPDGRAVFVHRTAPGDVAEVRVVVGKRRWARGELVALSRPSPQRRDPPCPHYERCGGCTLEHLGYSFQLRAKAALVREALRRIGGLDVPEPEVVPSPHEFRYRNRVSFTLRRGPEGVVAGFRELGHPDRVLDITGACLLPELAVSEVWDGVRAEWGTDANRLPSGAELRLTLRGTRSGAVALLVDGGYATGRPDELVARVRGLEAVWHRPAGGRLRLIAGQQTVPEVWAEEDLDLNGDVFTQVNRHAAAQLEEDVLARVTRGGPRRVLDAYCGVGLYARRFARSGIDVVGIEAHPDAVAEARRSASGASFLEGRVEDRLDEALPVDAAVLNPPRAGLAPEVPPRLTERPPARLVYVSCDPATLARDLARLTPTFRLVDVRCFDLFPQTAHVETVAELVRSGEA